MKLRLFPRERSTEIPRQAWESLAQHSIVSNPFYERWNLKAALENLELSANVEVVTAWQDDQLVGLFPICYSTRLPFFTSASVWKHDECYCTSPLVKNKSIWTEILSLLWKVRRVNMLINTTQTHHPLTPDSSLHLTTRSYQRAALDTTKSFQAMTEAWPRRRRKEWRRLLRKTMDGEHASYQNTRAGQACFAAFDAYTRIECRGWKGRAGTAIAQDKNKLNYYHCMIREGCKTGQVESQLLTFENKAIAASLRIIRGNIAFEVKTSYCESHRQLSPGVLLEMLNMRQLAEGDLQFADSCTQAGNQVMEALWPERVSVFNSVYFGPSLLSKLAWLCVKTYKCIKQKKLEHHRHTQKSTPASEHQSRTVKMTSPR